MNATTFQTIREGLGFSWETLAAELDIRERTIREFETGRRDIPAGVADEMNRMVDALLDRADRIDQDQVVATTRRERAVAWVVMLERPNIEIRNV